MKKFSNQCWTSQVPNGHTTFLVEEVLKPGLEVSLENAVRRKQSLSDDCLWTSTFTYLTALVFVQRTTSISFFQITFNGEMPAVGVKDVNQHEFVKALAEFLKKSGKLKVPEWTDVVKLGIHKELAPYEEDWFYVRTASVARHLYIRAPAGVGAMTMIYGGRKNNGTKPSHFQAGSSSVARKALQALEALKWVEKHPSGGRKLTDQGRTDLTRIAAQVAKKRKAVVKA